MFALTSSIVSIPEPAKIRRSPPASAANRFRGSTNMELGTKLDPLCAILDIAMTPPADA